jgi:hypothetical protein
VARSFTTTVVEPAQSATIAATEHVRDGGFAISFDDAVRSGAAGRESPVAGRE